MKYSDNAVTEAINSPAKRARAQNGNSKSSFGTQSSPSKKPKVAIETKIRSNQRTNMKPSVVTPEKSRKITNPYKKGSKKADYVNKTDINAISTAKIAEANEFINRLTDEEKELDESYELLQALKRKDDTSKGDSVIDKEERKGTEHSNPNSLNLDDIWKKASKEKSKTNDRMVIYCSKVLEVRNEFKVVLFPFLQNKKNEVYWCYKPEIFGFHNRCMAEVLSLSNKNFPVDMFTNYDEVFKRGDGDTIEVSNSMKTPNADPTRNGNKLLFYVVSVDKESDEKLDVVIHNFMNSLIMMQKHPQYRKYCLDKTFIEYGGKYNENMKLSICNDRAFERIMDSGIIHVEKNVSLYDLTNTDGVCYILNQMFAHSKPPLLTWGYALKSFCFNGGNIPKGFAFPK